MFKDVVKNKVLPFLVYLIRDRRNRAIFNNELKSLFLSLSPEQLTVFDVGGYYGESIQRFQKLFPGCTIHYFEPDNEPFNTVRDKFDSVENIHLNNVGVGAFSQRMLFYKSIVPGTSGFNKISVSSNWAKHRSWLLGVTPEQLTKEVLEVPVCTLDSYVQREKIPKIHIIKFDVEGFEDQCLRGCCDILQNKMVDAVQSELITSEFKEHKVRFEELRDFMAQYSYFVARIEKHRDIWFTESLQIFEVLFLKGELMETWNDKFSKESRNWTELT